MHSLQADDYFTGSVRASLPVHTPCRHRDYQHQQKPHFSSLRLCKRKFGTIPDKEVNIFPMLEAEPGEVTELLKAWSAGDPAALDQLARTVYDELRIVARRYMRNEREGHTLQTTALVNEVYCRLVDVKNVAWQSRAQFFVIAAQMMRRILVDGARARGAHKRGAGGERVNLDDVVVASPERDVITLALDDALLEFAKAAPRQAKVVEMRYFGGLSEEEIAEALGASTRTVERDWQFARAWLTRALNAHKV